MRTEHQHAAAASHIHPITLGQAAGDDPAGSHFPGAAGRLTEERKLAIIKTLVKAKIGDRESCNLFVRAMEYELSDFLDGVAAEQRAAAPQPVATRPVSAPVADTAALQAVARAARELADLVQAIPADLRPGLLQNLEAQDDMRRGYDQRYLDQMQIEAMRLAAACGADVAQAEAPIDYVEPQASAPSAATLHFVSSLGHMFEECFEKPPTAAGNGPFARALSLLADGLGVHIPTDPATLELALARG